MSRNSFRAREWNSFRLDEIISLEYGKGLPEEERIKGDYPVVGSNGIVGYHKDALVKGPGIVIGRKGTIGAVSWIDTDFWAIDTTYYVKTKRDDVFLKWLFYELKYINLSALTLSDVVPGLSREFAYAVKLPLPKFQEQQKIAEILQSVDNAIDKTKELIEKYKKMKQGLMYELFTRGITIEGKLRPSPENAPELYKDSLLGKIPKEWRVVTLNEIIDIKHGYAFRGEYFADQPNEYVLLTPGNFHVDGGLYFTSENTKYYLGDFPAEYILNNGDLLIVMTDLTKEMNILGNTVILEEKRKVLHNQRIGKILIKDPQSLLDYYLLFLMNHDFCKNTIRRTATGTTVRHTSPTRIKASIVPICDYDEQKRIAAILLEANREIHSEEEYMNKLIEIKTGLMQDLLTGKVRVAS